jgi:hypothetical protein
MAPTHTVTTSVPALGLQKAARGRGEVRRVTKKRGEKLLAHTTPSPVQPHHDVYSVASLPHLSGGLAGVRALLASSSSGGIMARISRLTRAGNQQEADIVHVREGDTDACPSIPFAPSWAGTQCRRQQGRGGGCVQRCNPCCRQWRAVQGSSAEEASRHCIACRQAGAVASTE